MSRTFDPPWQSCASPGWRKLQVKRAFSVSLGKMLQSRPATSSDAEVAYLKAQHVQWDGVQIVDLPTMWASEAEVSGLLVKQGDLLVCEGGEVGRAAIVDAVPLDRTIIQNALHLVRGKNATEPRFLNYLLRHAAEQGWFDVICNRSTITHFTVEKFEEMWIWLPDNGQQRAVADYLDRETTRLDALVAAKERLLGLLAEKRRALITRAVTRGLDANVPLRDSGISWLGEIPAHWELKRLKHVGRAIIGLTFDPADTVTDGSGVLVLRASNVRDQKIVLEDNLFVLMDIPDILKTRAGDILICSRSGSRALIGKNALIDQAAAGLTFGAFMTVFRSPHNEYLFYIFNSSLFDYQAGAFSTSTINQLTVETLNGMEVPLPPPSEQKAIVASLRERTYRLDHLVEATDRTIALLKERRSALIAAAVTGRINVGSGP